MPANIDSMFSGRGIVPWHKLGTVVQGTLTSADAIRTAGLDWPVVKHPAFARIPTGIDPATGKQTGIFKRIDNLFATVREDRNVPLGIVGAGYVCASNADLFSCLDGFVADGSAQYETAGSLGVGQTVWMLLVAGDDLKIAGDEIRPYVLARASHDGTEAIRIRPVTTRVVCANTLAMAMGEKVAREVRIRHTASVHDRLADAAKAFGILRESREAFKVTAEELVAASFTRSEMETLVKGLLGDRPRPEFPGSGFHATGNPSNVREINSWDKRFDAIMQDAWSADDLANVRFTKWGALNAVADYEQHLVRVKGTPLARQETAFRRATETGPLTSKAFTLLTA